MTKREQIERMIRGGRDTQMIMKAAKVSAAYVYVIRSNMKKAISVKLPKASSMTLEKVVERLNPDTVNHPPHYTAGKIEVIDFIEDQKLSYHLGNVVKYVCRADHKGSRLEDLKKAAWYLNREIAKG
jgi:hypothetical protein